MPIFALVLHTVFHTAPTMSNVWTLVLKFGKSILQVPDTGTQVLANTRPFLRSSIVRFWITRARSKGRKYHIFRQYWYTRNVPVFTNTGTFQYLGPEVYFFLKFQCWIYWPYMRRDHAPSVHPFAYLLCMLNFQYSTHSWSCLIF